MKTVRRLLYRDILWSVAFVAVAFLSLFYFIDVVDELEQVGRDGYTLARAAGRALLEQPGHFYELFPIAVLIGTIYAMARLAQSSEFTILRTAGLGPGRALGLLAIPGLAFALATWVVGDFVVPVSERMAAQARPGKASTRGPGAWLKERREATADSPARLVSVHVAGVSGATGLLGVHIFEFDAEGRLRREVQAERGQTTAGGWQLQQVLRTDWPTPDQADMDPPAPASNAPPAPASGLAAANRHAALGVGQQSLADWTWPTTLEPTVVSAALLPLQTMSTLELWRYTRHLADQSQAAQRHEIQFWKKALYPLACIVMVALALPFAYLHARAGGVSYKVFGGIMLGISFVLLNNASGHLGVLRGWTPWLAAATPSLLYLALSMGAFAWLVRYR